jgi:hypothetical protein
LTYNSSGYYQLRGGLLGGDALCTNMAGYDYYSPMDQAWPALSEYLAPNTRGSQPHVAEFYNPDLNQFFLTVSQDEQHLVDSGAVGNWHRTGNVFSTGGSDPVCRFYGNMPYGPDSHFFTVNPAECNYWVDHYNPNGFSWKLESYNAFYSTPAVDHVCPSGQVGVYRAYNNTAARPNHRFTTNYNAYLQTVASGWLGEGVLMCAPQ